MRKDVVALLVVDILASAFTAYELAGLYLPGWHTISWFAHTNRWVDYVIISAWLLAGLGGAVWFRNHARSNILK